MTFARVCKLEPYNWSALIAFCCQACGRPLKIEFREFDGRFFCRGCGVKIVNVPVDCIFFPCPGHYVRCGGTVAELSPAEQSRAEAIRLKGQPVDNRPSPPTDSTHDDNAEEAAAVITYGCTRCGVQYNARAGYGKGWFRSEKCDSIQCSVCRRVPVWDLVFRPGK